jgi:hypothetical protein
MKTADVLRTAFITLTVAALLVAAPASSGAEKSGKGRKPSRHYSIEQATSDRPQLHTIAFSGMAFLTGDFGASTFMPPGKIADFFGFQYMRDIDVAVKGHNPMFLNRVAGNVLLTLDSEQKGWFMDEAREQAPAMERLAMMRLPLIRAFHDATDMNLPEGANGLSKAAVSNYVGNFFELDARLSLRRAAVMSRVALSLSEAQKKVFGDMKFGDFNTWPPVEDKARKQLKAKGRGQSKLVNVAYMTLASEFFSWYAGSIKADTYFCPERHGTYFGGFYVKDMPAMGKRDYDIPLDATGGGGRIFLEILNPDQRQHITGLIELQRPLLAEIVEVRRQISGELRKYLAGAEPDADLVIRLGRRYGELDGEMSFYYASAFARVNQTLSGEQREALVRLRNLPDYTSAPYYLYSRPGKGKPDLDAASSLFSANSEAPLR